MANCAACVHPPKPVRGKAMSLLSTALLVLMPKCPYCLVGWAGALGLGSYATHALMLPTFVLIAFCMSQAVFFVTARRVGDRRALALAGLGVAAILAGTLLDLPSAIRWCGVALVLSASLVNAVLNARASTLA